MATEERLSEYLHNKIDEVANLKVDEAQYLKFKPEVFEKQTKKSLVTEEKVAIIAKIAEQDRQESSDKKDDDYYFKITVGNFTTQNIVDSIIRAYNEFKEQQTKESETDFVVADNQVNLIHDLYDILYGRSAADPLTGNEIYEVRDISRKLYALVHQPYKGEQNNVRRI